MKYGVHLALWMSRWPERIDEHIETAAKIGFDGVEISLLGMDDKKIKHLANCPLFVKNYIIEEITIFFNNIS